MPDDAAFRGHLLHVPPRSGIPARTGNAWWPNEPSFVAMLPLNRARVVHNMSLSGLGLAGAAA
ncbi:MAG: hypothetical protein JNK88_02320 [Mangrovicoccus sp.]|nr:hypothetical protein [Mangrovicoccus sp.]